MSYPGFTNHYGGAKKIPHGDQTPESGLIL